MSRYIHASALVVGEHGVLVRGASGAGKSRLVLALLALAEERGLFARLVGDDRIGLQAAGGRLLARAHPAISGQIEQRGIGILVLPCEPAAVVTLVVDLAAETAPGLRLPDDNPAIIVLKNARVCRLLLPRPSSARDAAETVLAALRPMALTIPPE